MARMNRSAVKSAVWMDVINAVETARYLWVPQSLDLEWRYG